MEVGLFDITFFWSIFVDIGVMILYCLCGEEGGGTSEACLGNRDEKLALNRCIWVEDEDVILIIGIAVDSELIMLA